jgi:hypothetical protein
MKSNAECDVPGCVVNQTGEYMTVNLSRVVGHIQKLKCAVSWGRVCGCRAGYIWSLRFRGSNR